MTDQVDQTLRTIAMTLGVVGLALSLRDGIDLTEAIAVGKFVLVGTSIMILPHIVFNVLGDNSEGR